MLLLNRYQMWFVVYGEHGGLPNKTGKKNRSAATCRGASVCL